MSSVASFVIEEDPQTAGSNAGDDAPDEEWILEHIRQIERMLIGGFDVVGIFVSSGKDYYNKYLTSFEQVLRDLHSQRTNADAPLLFAVNQNSKLTISLARIAGKVVQLEKATYKVSSVPSPNWVALSSCLQIDIRVPLAKLNQEQKPTAVAAMSSAIEYEVSKILSSTISTDAGSIIAADDRLPSKPKTIPVLFLQSLSSSEGDDSAAVSSGESSGWVTISGHVTCRAEAAPSSSFHDACESIKRDAARTLINRFCVAIDDLDAKGIKLSVGSQNTLCLPRRVYLKGAAVPFCDYVSSEEDISMSVSRFKALIGLEKVTEANIDQAEAPAPTLTPSPGLIKAQQAATRRQLARDTPKELPYVFLGISLLVVFFAVVLAVLNKAPS